MGGRRLPETEPGGLVLELREAPSPSLGGGEDPLLWWLFPSAPGGLGLCSHFQEGLGAGGRAGQPGAQNQTWVLLLVFSQHRGHQLGSPSGVWGCLLAEGPGGLGNPRWAARGGALGHHQQAAATRLQVGGGVLGVGSACPVAMVGELEPQRGAGRGGDSFQSPTFHAC